MIGKILPIKFIPFVTIGNPPRIIWTKLNGPFSKNGYLSIRRSDRCARARKRQ